MTNILQVLLGLALVNYLMLDVMPVPIRLVVTLVQLRKTFAIAAATLMTFIPVLLLSAAVEQMLIARFENSALSIAAFCVVLAGVLQCSALLTVRRGIVFASDLQVLLPLIFVNCIVLGMTMGPDDIGFGNVLLAGIARSIGFGLLLAGFTMFRDRLAGADVPAPLRGSPTTFIAAAVLSMILMGFAGIA